MIRFGWFPLFVFFVLVFLLPFLFAEIFLTAMVKLHLTPEMGFFVVIGIFLGSVINIPVTRIRREEEFLVDPLTMFGLGGWWPKLHRTRRETVIAVNVGGCIIPTLIAVYEAGHVVTQGMRSLVLLVVAVLINVAVCYWVAKPVPGIGIAMPAFLPPFVAASVALWLMPQEAPAVAFVVGVMGPLLGADLLHLREIPGMATGIASIGGAGTFDGIVLSGILAAYLA